MSHKHRAYVGREWDLKGAHQFQVLTSLGLREYHYMLDIGCGSFRGGRFFIMYLSPGHYFGVEPGVWLIEDGIKYEVGQDLIDIKKPTFDHNEHTNLSVFNRKFDYIIMHSILIHAPNKWISKCFREVAKVLEPRGILAATVKVEAGANEPRTNEEDWAYPHSRVNSMLEIEEMLEVEKLTMEMMDIKYPNEELIKWIIVRQEDVHKEG